MRTQLVVAAFVLTSLVPLAPLAQAASFTVTASNFAWTPGTLLLEPGDSVTFVNGTATPHTWVRDDGQANCNLPCTRTFTTVETIAYHCGIHAGMRGTIQVGNGIDVSIASPASGSTLAGIISVTGSADDGGAPVPEVRVRFDNGASVVATLGPGLTWSATLDSTLLPDGAHTIVARATNAGSVKEASLPITIDNPDRIDVRVALVGAPQGATTTAQISFTLRNEGNAPSGVVHVRGEYFYHGAWHLIGDVDAASVAAGANRFGSLTWDPEGVLVGRFTVRVTADPDLVLPDVDRSNNARSATAGWFPNSIEGIDLTDPV